MENTDMRVILVPVADRPECARALHTAFDLGKKLDASVSGCHIRPHRYSETSMSDAAWRRKNTKKAPEAAKKLYEDMADQHGYEIVRRPRAKPGALWMERVGSPAKVLRICGPVSDLTVVTRPTTRGGVADMFLTCALEETQRPVLVLPPAGRRNIGRHDTFASLDLRIARKWKLTKGSFTAFLEVSNLTNRRNPCCLDWDLEEDEATGEDVFERGIDYWMPLLPAIGVLWEF